MPHDPPEAIEYSLHELADVSGMSERNIRAYQAKGLLSPPERRGRRAVYGLQHFARLQLVRSLSAHGLTLKVIADLIERGTADDELARLSREDLSRPQTQGVALAMDRATVQRFEQQNPGLLDQLEASGLIERRDGNLLSNSTALGLIASMGGRGADFATCANIGIAAAEAAMGCRERVAEVVEACITAQGDRIADTDELRRLAVQLASTAFYDALTRTVLREGLSAPRR